MSAIATRAPSLARIEAMPRPTPLAPPVTTAVCPANDSMCVPPRAHPDAGETPADRDRIPPMQRFRAEDAKYAYSSDHASLGAVQPSEPFEVECVEGFGNSFSSPDDFTPERYAVLVSIEWAVT